MTAVCACCGLRRPLIHHDWTGDYCPDCIGHKATYPPVSGGAGAGAAGP